MAAIAMVWVLLAATMPGPLIARTETSAGMATLNIDTSKPLHSVSPMLYGLMTEEINYSYDGGLYAEMVRNRTFLGRENAPPAHWFVVQEGNANAAIKVDSTQGPSEAVRTSMLIDAAKADPENMAGALNEGYWGMAVRPNTTYKGSFYAKADVAGLGPVTVTLVNNNSGKSVAKATTAEPTTEWKRYEFTLTVGNLATSAANHLTLTVGHAGKIWLSLVSLFPPTYHDRANGNRIDIMQKLAAMHAKFLRLPGGNYLEGDEIHQRFDWKRTLGALVDRPGHPSPWRYESTDGMGLLEFMEWAEDLNIQPVLAVYAGYSLRGSHIAPGPALEPFVHEAMEELEFVMGDATGTTWGAVRAKLGHPKPFPVQYVEVGNEDQFDRSGSYEGRYAQFYHAIKEKYPQLQVIATTALKRMKPDVLDDHYYRRATEFFADVKHYDATDRKGPKIFVGEWATREGAPTTNFAAALGDAAWMTGMERNSDVIVLASYAPLFVNVNPGGMQWESNLIGYDAVWSFGSPSYYAQAMFAEFLGTVVPTSSLTGSPSERFFYSVTNDPTKGKIYLKMVNASSVDQRVNINLAEPVPIASDAELVTLSAPDPMATNSIGDRERIVPIKTKIRGVGATFSHRLPPYTIQAMELGSK
jgi:alpha-N-arabinofuranosidase